MPSARRGGAPYMNRWNIRYFLSIFHINVNILRISKKQLTKYISCAILPPQHEKVSRDTGRKAGFPVAER